MDMNVDEHFVFFMRTCFAIRWIFEVSTHMVDYIGPLSWLLLIKHGINFLFSIFYKLVKRPMF
jgi:hypothetical protein